MGVGNAVVIVDKDGQRVVELDDNNALPCDTFKDNDPVLHRRGAAGATYFLNVNDDALPTIESGLDMSRFGRAVLGFQVSGDSTWDCVPLYGDSISGVYMSGDKISIVGNVSKTVEVAGCSDFYALCRNKSGDGAGIKVWVKGYNL